MKFDDHFLSWVFIYGVLGFLTNFLLNIFTLGNEFFVLLFAGFLIALGSWVFYSILYKNKLRLNLWFLLWVATHAATYWFVTFLLSYIDLVNQFIYYVCLGLIFHLITHVFKYKIYNRFEAKNRNLKLFLTTAVIGVALFLISSLTLSHTIQTSNSNIDSSSSLENILESLLNSITLFKEECPQLPIPLEYNNKLWLEVMSGTQGTSEDPFDGWKVKSYDSAELTGLYSAFSIVPQIYCHEGNKEGQNPENIYCGYWDDGNNWDMGNLIYMEKTLLNRDGSIGKTIKKTFVNVYSREGVYIKTICGPSPEEVGSKKFKGKMNDLDSFFSLK